MTAAARSQIGSNFRRLSSNLHRNPKAMAMLAAMGIDEATVHLVGLGMKEPYRRSDGTRTENVLAFPVGSESARRRYAYLNLPGMTVNPENPIGWGPGAPEVISSGENGQIVLICASAIEVWQAQRAAVGGEIDVVAECSSQPGRIPAAWLDPSHWMGRARVVVTAGVASACAAAIIRVAQRPVERSRTTFVADEWPDDLSMSTRLVEILDDAAPEELENDDLLGDLTRESGDFAAKPISVHGGVKDARSFYAFTVERRRAAEGGRSDRVLHQYHTIVLRSDGTLLEARVLPAPAGTPTHRRVHSLSDGTRINPIQDPGHYCSWSLAGIRQFVADRKAGEDPCRTDPRTLAEQAAAGLRDVARLPCADDYWALTTFIFATYFFRLFDALPIIHLHGERGSGKSDLTTTIVTMSFNGQTMAQGSAAALVRLVRETGGLVALDDAETLVAGGGEMGQALKQGYKQLTATKILTMPGGRTEAIDFFGPRLVSNTLGLDPILASRAIRVPTSVSTDSAFDACKVDFNVAAWRDAAHAFAMSRIGKVADAYDLARSDVRNRHDEIFAPLIAIARVVGCDEMLRAVLSKAAAEA
ncbi:hypothetical protein [uncultured Sphingomonas sp.]|uniref:hypothetical protein n=1 Tax=uncultured Sphingomonas sp. TaxID=158754 RepID=UPI0025D910CE|nr:hypothetical protein [uncultured Sphingomonas sp.]